ncbi:hypothetical protein Ancab_031256 [Ancistrocladus abbreviatus]
MEKAMPISLVLIVVFFSTATPVRGLGTMMGGKVEIKDVKSNNEIQELGKFSVESYNHQHKNSGGGESPLEFEEVTSAEKQVVAGIKYFLKIKAKQNGESTYFNAEILLNPIKNSRELLKFASSNKSPAEPSAGANAPDILFGVKIQISNVKGSKIVTELGQFAVDTFNKNFHSLDGVSGPLEFEAVLAAEKQVVNGIKYRLKINAKDKEGDTKTFDADVIVKPNNQSKELVYFKPTNSALGAAPVVAPDTTVPTNPELNPNFAAGGLMEIEDVRGNKDVQELGKFSVEEYNKKFHSLNGVSSGKLTFEAVVAAEKQVIAGLKYYLKVQAKEGDATKTFDVEVYLNPSLQSKELTKFAPSATANGGGK